MHSTIANSGRRAIRRAPALRAIVKSRYGQHLIQTVRGARAVRESVRFVALQFGRPRRARYRLRGSDFAIFVRHCTRDVHILNEIFGGTAGRRVYEPPPDLGSLLDRRPSPRVLDVGGNIGLFGADVLSRWPGATIRSFEPDPANGDLLAKVISANRLEKRWTLVRAAVANRAGDLEFTAGLFADSHVAARHLESSRSPADGTLTVPSVDLFAEDHHVDLLKMDIEGAEWPILSDSRLRDLRATVLVLEWHARGCSEPEPHACVLRLLREAGYGELYEVESGPENGVLWARRRGTRTNS
jgi:FkbM family methyltransferase